MKFDWTAIKKSTAFKVAVVIVVPTVIVGAVYGGVYIHKKIKERAARKAGLNGTGVDTTGMNSYIIKFPFKYQPDLLTNGKFFEEIGKVKYSFVSDKVTNDENKQPSEVEIEIMASPVDIQKIKAISEGLNKEIKIEDKK